MGWKRAVDERDQGPFDWTTNQPITREQVMPSARIKVGERVRLYLTVMVIFCETTGGLCG